MNHGRETRHRAASYLQYHARVPIAANQIVHDDCCNVLPTLAASYVDLIFVDPPFHTGRLHASPTNHATFDDRWESRESYLGFLRSIVEQAHRVLKPTGSILLHCDWRTVHHLRLMLDDVFGEEQFVNHLIWSYGLGGSSPRRFARKHDDILFYGRTEQYYFDPPRVPATSARMKGQLKKATDILHVPSINNMAAERTGYPTQKPLALLELLVQACSPLDGLVLDPCCGSGTTLVAARKLRRGYLGIDASADAIAIAAQRLKDENSEHERDARASHDAESHNHC